MIGDLFDNPWKILIIAVFLIVVFGANKLPTAARSLGKSMRILKAEVQGLHEDEPVAPTPVVEPAQAPAQLQATTPATDAQTQIEALKQQVQDLQQAAATANGAADSKQTR
jgi:sec-independent protein translocase protein TatA